MFSLIFISVIVSFNFCLTQKSVPTGKPLWIELNKAFVNETFGGDMIFVENKSPGFLNKYLPQGSSMIWPNRKIPYQLSNSFSEKQKNIFKRAVDWFHNNTCVRWVQRNRNDRNYVNVQKNGGCRSVVGRARGAQLLSLENGCFYSLTTVIHEMMHSTGFIHEHQRPDRDQYISIKYENIEPGMESQFSVNRDKDYFYDYKLPYDIHSVMHYTEKTFSKGSGDTIVAKNKQKLSCSSHEKCPTELDAKKINSIYRC